MNKRFLLSGLLVVSITLFTEKIFASTPGAQIVDFGVSYPHPTLKNGATRRQKVNAGVSFRYQFFLNDRFGLSFNPNLWFNRIRYNNSQGTLFALAFEAGPSIRPLPHTYFDPTIHFTGGFGVTDAGKTIKRKWIAPVSGEIGITLWRERSRFRDHELGLQTFLGTKYYWGVVDLMKPLFFHAGLSMRGSF
jgi:hypothetical protein